MESMRASTAGVAPGRGMASGAEAAGGAGAVSSAGVARAWLVAMPVGVPASITVAENGANRVIRVIRVNRVNRVTRTFTCCVPPFRAPRVRATDPRHGLSYATDAQTIRAPI